MDGQLWIWDKTQITLTPTPLKVYRPKNQGTIHRAPAGEFYMLPAEPPFKAERGQVVVATSKEAADWLAKHGA